LATVHEIDTSAIVSHPRSSSKISGSVSASS
jgi:hypothetical protein